MTLDLNIGYYTIYISPEIHYLTTIVTEFGKSRYNRVPMVLCASNEIFQAKADNILGDINGVKKYTNSIIVLGKGIFSQHIYQLIVVFARLNAKVLKVTYPK